MRELPELTRVNLYQCWELTSILPLRGCARLTKLNCEECDELRGPTSLQELRAWVG